MAPTRGLWQWEQISAVPNGGLPIGIRVGRKQILQFTSRVPDSLIAADSLKQTCPWQRPARREDTSPASTVSSRMRTESSPVFQMGKSRSRAFATSDSSENRPRLQAGSSGPGLMFGLKPRSRGLLLTHVWIMEGRVFTR